MNKIKGLVLESTKKYTYLLTPEGEYFKFPARGQLYEVGSEIELEDIRGAHASGHPRKKWLRLGALAAGLLLVVGLFMSQQFSPAPGSPVAAAYLDLDINPSLSLALDEEGRVLELTPLNADGEIVLESMQNPEHARETGDSAQTRPPEASQNGQAQAPAPEEQQAQGLQGQTAQEALEKILDKSLELEYLSPEKENAIFISLAAPENYPLNNEQLQEAVREHVLQINLDAYLKVSALGLREAEEARGNNVSMNAIRLQEEMTRRNLPEPGDENEDAKGDAAPETTGPPPPVQELLQNVPASEVLFEDGEFIGGRGRSEEKAPPGQSENAHEKESGSVKEKETGRENEDKDKGANEEKDTGKPEESGGPPPHVPPVEENERPEIPPIRNKEGES